MDIKTIVNKNGYSKLQHNQKIPYNIIQTFETRDVPISMWLNSTKWTSLNPEYNYLFFDANDRIRYVTEYDFTELNISKSNFKKAYNKIKPGAGKADLFRLLIIYEIGGCYVDIDTSPLVPLNQIIKSNDEVVSGIGGRGDFHQWCLIYIKKHPFIRKTLEIAVNNILNETFINNKKSMEWLCGPPALDLGIKSVLGYETNYKFKPGNYLVNNISYRLLLGDYLNHHIEFKQKEYKDTLKILGVKHWGKDDIFN
mgnify:CR=1 FL=1|tara:strand:- start:2445 stop:3206 length:762 start_codon:yes stop_codon:yes gene_type:complete